MKQKLYDLKTQILKDLSIKDDLKKDLAEQIFKIEKELAINYTRCCTQLLCLVDDFNFLTKGKTYKMESEPDGHYVVIDDFGQERLLWQKYFERLN